MNPLWLKSTPQRLWLLTRLRSGSIFDWLLNQRATSVVYDCAVDVENNSTKAWFGWTLATFSLLISLDLFCLFFSLPLLLDFYFGFVYFLHVLLEWLPHFDLISLISLIALSFLRWVLSFPGSRLTIRVPPVMRFVFFCFAIYMLFICYQIRAGFSSRVPSASLGMISSRVKLHSLLTFHHLFSIHCNNYSSISSFNFSNQTPDNLHGRTVCVKNKKRKKKKPRYGFYV